MVTEEGSNGSIRGDATGERDPGRVARRAAQQRHRTLTDKEGRNEGESHSKMRTSVSNENGGGAWDASLWRLYIVMYIVMGVT